MKERKEHHSASIRAAQCVLSKLNLFVYEESISLEDLFLQGTSFECYEDMIASPIRYDYYFRDGKDIEEERRTVYFINRDKSAAFNFLVGVDLIASSPISLKEVEKPSCLWRVEKVFIGELEQCGYPEEWIITKAMSFSWPESFWLGGIREEIRESKLKLTRPNQRLKEFFSFRSISL